MVGERGSSADEAAERYVTLLLREMAASPRGEAHEAPLRSLYFGGGTPSLTPPRLLARVISCVREVRAPARVGARVALTHRSGC